MNHSNKPKARARVELAQVKINQPVTQKEVRYAPNTNILSTTAPSSHITYVNDSFVDICGFSEAELMKEPHNIIRHPDMPPAAFEMMWDRLQGGDSWMGLVKNRCKNGDHYWVHAYATPIQANGQIREYQSVRVEPSREEVSRAESLYQKLVHQPQKAASALKGISIKTKQFMGSLIALALLIGLGFGLEGVVEWNWQFAGIVALASSTGLNQWLFTPFYQLTQYLKKAIDDPVARHVYTGRQDEIGQIQLALKMQSSEQRAMAGRVNDYASHLVTSSQTLEQNLNASLGQIQNQYIAAEQLATATEEMSASVQEVARNAQNTSSHAHAANDQMSSSKEGMNQALTSINTLSGNVEQVSEVIGELAIESEQIGSVVDVIRAIAEQTNLLALNAAIEAARAGEQGRGFAVVADEVRSLATKTHDSTEEIMAMIDKLQSLVSRAVTTTDSAAQSANESVGAVQSADTKIDEATQSVSTINDMNLQIAAAVEEQSQVANEISQNIISLKQQADLIQQQSQGSTTASHKVAEMASELHVLSERYWNQS